MKINNALRCGLGLFLIATCEEVRGDLLIYEGFDYEMDSTLTGQSGGIGFLESWRAHPLTPGAEGTIVRGLSFSDYPVTGNAVALTANSSAAARVVMGREMDANFGPPPQTVWASLLYSYSATSSLFYGEMCTGNKKGLADTARFGLVGSSIKSKFGVRYEGVGSETWGGSNTPSTTYLLIGKYEGGVRATLWILSAANYDAIKSGGITEEKLNAQNSGKLTTAFVDRHASELLPFLLLSVGAFESGTLTSTFDELKYGSSLADVTSAR